MLVTVMEESGYNMASLGMSLSFKDRAVPVNKWWTTEKQEKMKKVLKVNAGRGKGHDKFLRQIMLWVLIDAPRYWWSEFDTYKVGTVAQSESTMHTLAKRDMKLTDLESSVESDIQLEEISLFNKARSRYVNSIGELKKYVPESYLQRRLVTMNYAVLHCMIKQRINHRLPEWGIFLHKMYSQVKHPDLLPELLYETSDK